MENKESIWKLFQNSKIELISENNDLWDLFIDIDEIEDFVMGYINQGGKLPNKKIIIDELMSKLECVKKNPSNEDGIINLDIQRIENHVLILQKLITLKG